jgi:hypothetical protein
MFKLPIYSKKELLFAYEFGAVLSEVAKEKGTKITPAMSLRAEEVIVKELKANGFDKTAKNFIPLVLAVLEV